MDEANKQQEKMVLFDSITGAIYGPNANGASGYVARAVAPQVSYQIGQYFKGNDFLNGLDSGNRSSEGSAPHILAHGILAAAVSAATGNDVTTGALSAMGAEAGAKYVADYLYPDVKPSDLAAEQKATVSSITTLAGLGVGASTGDVSSAVSAGETAKNAVNDNGLLEILMPETMSHVVNNRNQANALHQSAQLRKITTTGVVVAASPIGVGLGGSSTLIKVPAATGIAAVAKDTVTGAAIGGGLNYAKQKYDCLVCKPSYGQVAKNSAVGGVAGAYGSSMTQAAGVPKVTLTNIGKGVLNPASLVIYSNQTMINQVGNKAVSSNENKEASKK